VGVLALDDYVDAVLPASAAVLGPLGDLGVPRIHFGVGTGELLPAMGEAGADVVGVDFRLSLTEAARRTGNAYALQGNLDPALLFAPRDVLRRRVQAILAQGDELPGHIFNLGHGVPPDADPAALAYVVELVHAHEPPARA
jgi:uroporphyrinogen decarboxylase